MNSNKIVIIVLILIALTFISFVVYGSLRKDQPPPKKRSAANSFTKSEGFDGWRKWYDQSLSWLQPRVKLPCEQGGELSEKCENLQQRTAFLVLPDNTQPLRVATFRLVSGSANVCYRVNENAASCDEAKNRDDDAKPNFEAQSFDLPNSDADDPHRSAIVVLKKGGKITVVCKIIPCRVDLE